MQLSFLLFCVTYYYVKRRIDAYVVHQYHQIEVYIYIYIYIYAYVRCFDDNSLSAYEIHEDRINVNTEEKRESAFIYMGKGINGQNKREKKKVLKRNTIITT